MLSMIQVQVQHSFYQNFPPLGNPCFATLPDNIPFIKFSTPPGNPCFQLFKFKYNIPLIKILPPPPLGNPCFATLPDNIPFIKFSTPLATHAFNDSSSSTTFLLSKFCPPPLATGALRPYLTTFLYQIFPPLGNPCFATLPDNIPPPLATHAFNDSSSSTTFLLSKFSFPLGNPCFATLPDNIPFIKFSPPLATHAFDDSSSSTTFLLSKFSPYPGQTMLCDPT